MLSKLFRTRNRKVVSLPQEALDVLGLQDGMELDVVVDVQNRQIVLRSVEKKIDPRLAQKIADSIRQQSSRASSLAPKNRLI
jgi:antitoxin component of MazEF toxin-antitoxin module